jgi:hypothetical protein
LISTSKTFHFPSSKQQAAAAAAAAAVIDSDANYPGSHLLILPLVTLPLLTLHLLTSAHPASARWAFIGIIYQLVQCLP